jgi:hypothetical protein
MAHVGTLRLVLNFLRRQRDNYHENRKIFGKGVLDVKYVSFFSAFFWAPSSRWVGLHIKCLIFLCEFNQNCDVTADISRTTSVKVYENPF